MVDGIPSGWNTLTNPQPGLVSRTWNYNPYAESISAVQKYVRRSDPYKAAYFAIDCGLTGPAALTNSWNRLMVIAVEDIGLADPLAIVQAIEAFGKHKNDYIFLGSLAYSLAERRKCRLNDWASLLYRDDRSLSTAKKSLSVYPDPIERFAFLLEKKEEIEVGEIFLIEQFLWVVASEEKGVGFKTYRRLWDVLSRFVPSYYFSPIREIGKSTNWNKSDKTRLLILHLVNMILYASDRFPSQSEIVSVVVNPRVVEIYAEIMERKEILPIPDFAKDKHTVSGKSLWRGLAHFVLISGRLNDREKSLVEIEDAFLERTNLIQGTNAWGLRYWLDRPKEERSGSKFLENLRMLDEEAREKIRKDDEWLDGLYYVAAFLDGILLDPKKRILFSNPDVNEYVNSFLGN